jgi:hypothetical protein
MMEPVPIVYTEITDFLGGSIAGEYAAGASGAEPLAQRSERSAASLEPSVHFCRRTDENVVKHTFATTRANVSAVTTTSVTVAQVEPQKAQRINKVRSIAAHCTVSHESQLRRSSP